MSSTVTVDQLTKAYIRLRDEKARIEAKHKDELKDILEQQETVKRALLGYCKDEGLDSIKTQSGTVSRSVRTRYWTSDWETMREFIKEHDVMEFFEKRLNQGEVRRFLEENPEAVPKGLNVDSEYTVSVRKPTKK